MATKTQKLSLEQEADYTPEQDAKIAELAYLKAERRGFTPGHDLDDWLEAEQECLFNESNDSRVVTGKFGIQAEA